MANRVPAPNVFATTSPNWSLAQLDQNFSNTDGAINDSSLGSVNGPLTDSGSVNAYSVTCTYGSPSAYNNGMTVFFKPANTNTGPATLTVSPLSSLPITNNDGTALGSGTLVAGSTYGAVCDGTAFRLFSLGQSQIWSVRLRSFNALAWGNCNFEVDQRNCHAWVGSQTGFQCDRWTVSKSGTLGVNTQDFSGQSILVPGTNFQISSSYLNMLVATAEPSLAAGDFLQWAQYVEGPMWRELASDVHSISFLCRSNVAGLQFAISLRDFTGGITKSLVQLCTIPSANTWTLIQLPNLPVWPSGNFTTAAGSVGYLFCICLAAGSTNIAPTAGTWQTGNFSGAPGMSNFAATANNTFDIAFIQHEPGPVCSQLMDLDFVTNLDRCQRYFQKSYDYGTKPGTSSSNGVVQAFVLGGYQPSLLWMPFKRVMAKPPTMTGYAPVSGAINTVHDFTANTDRAISGAVSVGDEAFGGFSTSSSNAGNAFYQFHYTADTGW